MTNLVWSTYLEIPDREKGGIERKGNFINYFIVPVGPMMSASKRPEYLTNISSAAVFVTNFSILKEYDLCWWTIVYEKQLEENRFIQKCAYPSIYIQPRGSDTNHN